MFKQLFQSMNETLDQIAESLPVSHGTGRQALLDKLQALRLISDGIIEEWLVFEEKLSRTDERSVPRQPASPAAEADKANPVSGGDPVFGEARREQPSDSLHYQRGEGYFKLFMFAEAAREFEMVVSMYPGFVRARLLLALCFLQRDHIQEANSHLQIIAALAEDGSQAAQTHNVFGLA